MTENNPVIQNLPKDYDAYLQLCERRGIEPLLDNESFDATLNNLLAQNDQASCVDALQRLHTKSEQELMEDLGAALHLGEVAIKQESRTQLPTDEEDILLNEDLGVSALQTIELLTLSEEQLESKAQTLLEKLEAAKAHNVKSASGYLDTEVTEEDIERRVAQLCPRFVSVRCEEILEQYSLQPKDAEFWYALMRHCAASEGTSVELPFFDECLSALSSQEEPEARRSILSIAKKYNQSDLVERLVSDETL